MVKNIILFMSVFIAVSSPASFASEGTKLNPKYHKIIVTKRNNDIAEVSFYSFKDNGFSVAGLNLSIEVVIDKPAKDVWPHFKNFNTWTNKTGYYYWDDTTGKPGIFGDMQGKVVRLGPKEGGGLEYVVHTVIPNKLIGKKEIPRERDGVISSGDHAFILTENNGKTLITMMMQHESKASHKTEDELLKLWMGFIPRLNQENNYFLDDFIRDLRAAVKAG